jgi:1-acyl-sn-glycerol-3-phosphate acyltransferase
MKSLLIWLKIVYRTIVCSIRYVKSGDRSILKQWASEILKLSSVDVECRGTFPDRPFMIMANHESYYDIFALFYCCDFNLVWFAKKELFRLPFFGKALYKSNAIEVDRKNPKQASFAILKALKERSMDEVIVIFPQGTRKAPNAFKQGGLLIAKKKSIPIVPIKIENSKNILHPGSWKINSGKITVNIFDKIDVEKYSIEELEKIMREKIYE